jgi:hypothetical protein
MAGVGLDGTARSSRTFREPTVPEIMILGLDERALHGLASEARRRNLDLGTAAGVLLYERLGTAEVTETATVDLDALAGTWTTKRRRRSFRPAPISSGSIPACGRDPDPPRYERVRRLISWRHG